MTGIENRNDGQLLAAFAEEGDEAAFAALVERHGKMVQSACMRVLGEFHEAQDVTQAVFLTLARKAAQLRKDSSVGGWLHRVATCLARDVRSADRSRKQREEKSVQASRSVTPTVEDARALREELDYAVEQLPSKYRQPLVLFHLEERSLDDTALALGLKASAASARLVRAREMLRQKLVRRGVGVASVGALTTLLSAEAGAAVLPASFVSATVKAAGLAAAGKLAAGVTAGTVSANVAALTKGAVQMMLVAKMKMVAAGVVACALAVGTVAVVAQQATAPAQSRSWMANPGGQVDINPLWGTFDRLTDSGELVVMVQPVAGQGGGAQPAPVEVRLKIADGREDIVKKAAAGIAKGAKVKVGCVRDSTSRERFVWDLATM